MDNTTKVLFFDTETSGFISKDKDAHDPDQAWCVQVGAILATMDEELDKLDLLVKANGREMNYRAQEVHGISVEYADENGLEEVEVAEAFGLMMRKADLIVCHNYAFDWKYVYQMLERNLDDLSDEARSAFFLDLPHFCTMKDGKVKSWVGARNVRGAIKWPKLIELYEKVKNTYEAKHDAGIRWEDITGFDFNDDVAHDAYADIKATSLCFFEMINLDVIKLEV